MDTSLRILVIILSATLVLFLLLAIIVLVKVVDILHSLKRITNKAEKIAESAEVVGEFFRKSSGPLALGRFVTNIAKAVKNRKETNKRKE